MKAVIFDLDGTLLNTVESMEAAGSKMLKDLGLSPRPAEEYKLYAGDGAKTLVERVLHACGKDDPALLEKAFPIYMGYFEKTCTYHVAPYPGIVELLQELKRRMVKLAVLSNKPHQQTVDVISRYFPEHLFDYVQGQCESVPKKPSPVGAKKIAEQFGIEAKDCFYVGDTNVDMQTGKSAGMKTIGVLWGFRTERELRENHADRIIASPKQLLELLA
ncbi:HAD family hydrolase [Massiliimalia timonensis]|uniref:HAD family hydrolase n=1 Tax=Massiliimalia timonensis TaxID=1987501 RepID=UPI000B8AC0D0|nr:HAD family hydrolase [Massiliimalia timonensis]MBS7175422.1 HAD family hydrolase [Clostridiales bacterium]